MTVEDLNWGSCPAKFSAKVSVAVEFGTSESAKAIWTAGEKTGDAGLAKTGTGLFSGKVSGMPSKTPVWISVAVTGPDGTTTTDPIDISHNC